MARASVSVPAPGGGLADPERWRPAPGQPGDGGQALAVDLSTIDENAVLQVITFYAGPISTPSFLFPLFLAGGGGVPLSANGAFFTKKNPKKKNQMWCACSNVPSALLCVSGAFRAQSGTATFTHLLPTLLRTPADRLQAATGAGARFVHTRAIVTRATVAGERLQMNGTTVAVCSKAQALLNW